MTKFASVETHREGDYSNWTAGTLKKQPTLYGEKLFGEKLFGEVEGT